MSRCWRINGPYISLSVWSCNIFVYFLLTGISEYYSRLTEFEYKSTEEINHGKKTDNKDIMKGKRGEKAEDER